MERPKAAPAPANTELIKFANAKASLIIEEMFDFPIGDGDVVSKIVVVIVRRDAANRAEVTLRYYLDIPDIKVLMHDLKIGALHQEFDEFKKRGNVQRAVKITPQDEHSGSYRLSIMNTEGVDQQWLFFDLSRFQVRCLAVTVLDYIRNYEMARLIREWKME